MPVQTRCLLLPLAKTSTIAPTEPQKLNKTVAENQKAEQTLELRLLNKSMVGDGGDQE